MHGLLEIALALMLTGVSHEMGHQTKADSLSQPLEWSGTKWTTSAKGTDLAKISGAGFKMQDTLNRARKNKAQNAANAIHKLTYILSDRGDLKSIEKASGKKALKVARGALAVSAISDMLKAFGKFEGDSGFMFGQSSNGTSMLIFGGVF